MAKVEVPVERFGIDRSVVDAELTTSNALPIVEESPQTESLLYGVEVPTPTSWPVERNIVDVAVRAVPPAA